MAEFRIGDYAISSPSVSNWRRNLGEWADLAGTAMGLPETGFSERVAGGSTANTQNWLNNAYAADQGPAPEPTSDPDLDGGIDTSGFDSAGTNYSTDTNLFEEEQRQAEEQVDTSGEQLRNSISSQWDGVFNYLDQVAGVLPDQYNNQKQRVSNLYGSQMSTLNTEKAGAEERLGGYRTEATQNQASSLRDLAQNFRNSLQAGQSMLGGMGAGDSSAVGRLTGALAKSANRTRGNILGQTNKIMNDINMRENEVIRTYEDQTRQLDTWKSNKLLELGDWYNNAKNQLDYERSRASGEKASALATLDQQLYQSALNRLSQIETASLNWKQSVDAWARDRAGRLETAKQSILAQTQGVDPTVTNPGMNNQMTAMGGLGRGNAPVGYGAFGSSDDENRGLSTMGGGFAAGGGGGGVG